MSAVPTRWGALAFAAKAAGLRLRRTWHDGKASTPRFSAGDRPGVRVAEIRSPLYGGGDPAMELGKVQNLRIAASRLNGIRVLGGGMFSFWRQVGRCTRRRGYIEGREIRQGCVVPSVGGGICALTNGLYEAALRAGIEVVERHPHTRVIPGSAAERGMDATVAWNYLDLRLRAPFAWAIEVRLTRDELIVAIYAEETAPQASTGARRRP